MKMFIFCILFLFISCNNKAYKCVVATDNSTYLVANVKNPITIAVSGLRKDNINIKSSSNGKVYNTKEKGRFIVEPNKTGTCTIDIIYGKNIKESKTFRVIEIDTINVRFCCPDNEFLMPVKVKEHMGLSIFVKNSLFREYDEGIRIKSYRLRIYRSNELAGESWNEGAEFTEKTKQLIQESRKGDKLNFEEIFVGFPNGNTKEANPLRIEMGDE